MYSEWVQGAKSLHYDHDLPYSRGGSSITVANVRLLCACNLRKSAKIEAWLPLLAGLTAFPFSGRLDPRGRSENLGRSSPGQDAAAVLLHFPK